MLLEVHFQFQLSCSDSFGNKLVHRIAEYSICLVQDKEVDGVVQAVAESYDHLAAASLQQVKQSKLNISRWRR